MYVTTFYSYKGGVGRSMALANVGVLLAKAGNRVLLVDFDLEAPGLPSYGPLGAATGLPGMVDYVDQYRRELVAPDVSEFIAECSIDETASIWVMPAGDNGSPAYGERLGGIDWTELYRSEAGFLMFEDMRQQWAMFEDEGFDYVLIDSRTGHTDVGGICTRHLPDAVVVMFVPTMQNIAGLEPIVAGIRLAERPGGEPIRLHFCPSNVPDEYDEDGVLADRLEIARARLGYGDAAAIAPATVMIHHRSSLELLDQKLIVLTRAQSKLAREYGELQASVISENFSDREGALLAIGRLPAIYEAARAKREGRILQDILERVDEIRRHHPHDGDMAVRAAAVFDLLGEYEEEIECLTTAIRAEYKRERVLLHRASTYLKLGANDSALADLRAILTSPTGSAFEFQPAARLLGTTAKDPVAEALPLFTASETRPRAKIALARQILLADPPRGDVVAEEMLRLLDQDGMSGDLTQDVRNVAELALVGSGDFAKVLEFARRDDANLPDRFNAAVARWGAEGRPPLESFRKIAALPRAADEDANAHQCFALLHGALGDRNAALEELDLAEERTAPGATSFSCWSFSYKSAAGVRSDIEEMRSRIRDGRDLKPPFLMARSGERS